MYYYYYIMKQSLTDTWQTSELTDFLRGVHFLEEQPDGIFSSRKPYLNISLMKVRNKESWSCADYHESETNYVSIITSVYSDEDEQVRGVLKRFEEFLGFPMRFDE